MRMSNDVTGFVDFPPDGPFEPRFAAHVFPGRELAALASAAAAKGTTIPLLHDNSRGIMRDSFVVRNVVKTGS